jgi:hypothetical protein
MIEEVCWRSSDADCRNTSLVFQQFPVFLGCGGVERLMNELAVHLQSFIVGTGFPTTRVISTLMNQRLGGKKNLHIMNIDFSIPISLEPIVGLGLSE